MSRSDKAKKTSFPGQHEGEDVQLVFHQHPVVMRRALIYGMLIILASVIPLYIWPLSSLALRIPLYGLGLVALYWFYIWFGWYYSIYIVTNLRVIEIIQHGFFNRRVKELTLDKIHNVNYHIKGFQAVIFQYGDITAQSYVGDMEMKMIHHPVKVHTELLEIVRSVASSTPPGV